MEITNLLPPRRRHFSERLSNHPVFEERADVQRQLADIQQTLDLLLDLTVQLLDQGETLKTDLLHVDAHTYRNALHLDARLVSTQLSAVEARQMLEQLIQTPSSTQPPSLLRA